MVTFNVEKGMAKKRIKIVLYIATNIEKVKSKQITNFLKLVWADALHNLL